jgi:hypothetical protein
MIQTHKFANSYKKTKSLKIENYVLHYSNMRAYFDDGTIITCPRCAFTKENVENQSNLSDEPVQTYELKDGSLAN